jgi:protein-tyrosine phosphatase
VQVNISSLLGGVTDSVAGFCRKLLKQDMIHIFGTDAHRDVGRAPYMGEGASYIERKFGKETAERLLITNPKKILMNKII